MVPNAVQVKMQNKEEEFLNALRKKEEIIEETMVVPLARAASVGNMLSDTLLIAGTGSSLSPSPSVGLQKSPSVSPGPMSSPTLPQSSSHGLSLSSNLFEVEDFDIRPSTAPDKSSRFDFEIHFLFISRALSQSMSIPSNLRTQRLQPVQRLSRTVSYSGSAGDTLPPLVARDKEPIILPPVSPKKPKQTFTDTYKEMKKDNAFVKEGIEHFLSQKYTNPAEFLGTLF